MSQVAPRETRNASIIPILKRVYGGALALWRSIFRYPRTRIALAEDHDYDAYWKRKRADRIGELSSWQQARADIIADVLKDEQDIVVADVGCGDGSILKYISERLPVRTSIGYDVSEFALAQAARFGVQTHRIDMQQRGWEEALLPCDYLLLLEVIEHLADAERVVEVARTRARRGVFVSVPNSGYFTYRLRLLFGSMPAQWLNFPNEHLRFWTVRDMRWWLRALGYEHARLYFYKGVPLLNQVWPALFAAGQVVYIPAAGTGE